MLNSVMSLRKKETESIAIFNFYFFIFRDLTNRKTFEQIIMIDENRMIYFENNHRGGSRGEKKLVQAYAYLPGGRGRGAEKGAWPHPSPNEIEM